MIREISGVRKDTINIQDRCSGTIMDVRRDSNRNISFRPPPMEKTAAKHEIRGTLSAQNSPRRLIPASYFSLESLVLLVGLTASLLILPLILPPLPPPPFMLLLVPIGILAVLMILAFMPSSNAKAATFSYL
ncbi:PREDICTED: ARGOS-like protein [Tarenaya hassleriana]|uniref:ARGOS-like protein n=1 Tax=Tarenaya hassleriana TaxID=28532 RepID=UPI00053C0EAB|nr:PREDICTED: ARGOS-like protein [Tarenaya hassleriana]XP_010526919.1 PREDICTED: ARGOS-like protein [Tarenaya hassleriana]